jgi:hypothetical protein
MLNIITELCSGIGKEHVDYAPVLQRKDIRTANLYQLTGFGEL